MTCVRAQEFLAKKKITPIETVDARKVRFPRAEALKLAKAADKVLVAKGQGVTIFNMLDAPPADAELAAAILGPTGNLRSPTMRIGGNLLVGFNDSARRAAGL